jgi:hypothetical protein
MDVAVAVAISSKRRAPATRSKPALRRTSRDHATRRANFASTAGQTNNPCEKATPFHPRAPLPGPSFHGSQDSTSRRSGAAGSYPQARREETFARVACLPAEAVKVATLGVCLSFNAAAGRAVRSPALPRSLGTTAQVVTLPIAVGASITGGLVEAPGWCRGNFSGVRFPPPPLFPAHGVFSIGMVASGPVDRNDCPQLLAPDLSQLLLEVGGRALHVDVRGRADVSMAEELLGRVDVASRDKTQFPTCSGPRASSSRASCPRRHPGAREAAVPPAMERQARERLAAVLPDHGALRATLLWVDEVLLRVAPERGWVISSRSSSVGMGV